MLGADVEHASSSVNVSMQNLVGPSQLNQAGMAAITTTIYVCLFASDVQTHPCEFNRPRIHGNPEIQRLRDIIVVKRYP